MAESYNIITGTSRDVQFLPFAKVYPEPKFQIRKSSGKQWIQLGENDDLPAYVEGLLDKSPDHAAIVNGTIQYVCGNGLVIPNDPRAKAMYQNGQVNLASPNDLGEISKKLARDLVVFGGCLVNVRWTMDKTRIADVHYVPVSSMRIDAEYEGYWLSSDWGNIRKNVPEFYPPFSTEEGGSQLLYVRAPSARMAAYAMPAYWSAREAIDIQAGMSTYNLKRVLNNFYVSGIIKCPDNPTQEEYDKFNVALKKYASGPDGEFTGGFLLTSVDAEVVPFNSGSGPKDFDWISTFADQRLRAAHRVPNSGAIFGLSRGDNPQGFSPQDNKGEFDLYAQTVVRPYQLTLLGLWDMLAQASGIKVQWEIDPFVLGEIKVKEAEASTSGGTSVDAAAPAVDGQGVTSVAATALNGAQIDSLVAIITSVSTGQLTKETALPLIQAAFPTIPLAQVKAMLGGTQKQEPPKDPVPPVPPNKDNPNEQPPRLP